MSDAGSEWVEMEVGQLAVESNSGAVLLVLRAQDGASLMMIIGIAEGTSIAKELEGAEFARPLTHDLMRDVVDTLGARLDRVEVVDLRDGTYFAELVLEDAGGHPHRVDCRPSDAIALALRADARILVHEQVVRKASRKAQEFPPATDKEEWKRLLEDMDPEDFGKYKM